MFGRFFNLLLHLGYWIGILFFLRASSFQWGWVISNDFDTLWPHTYGALSNALIFYGTCFYLIPKFYNTKSKRTFYSYSVLVFLLITFVELVIDFEFAKGHYSLDYASMNGEELFSAIMTQLLVYIFPVNLVYYLFAFGYRFPIDKKLQEEKEQQLAQERLHAELKYLKAQIDPHTLFNGMNSIYHLIEKDPIKAQEVVLKFSALLRYQLYECNEDFIPMEKEVNYLYNYIALNKIRKEADAEIDVEIQYDANDIIIPPLLFTPFIENAFKYLSNDPLRKNNQIKIQLLVEETHTIFQIKNTVDQAMLHNQEQKNKGIGIANTVSRLQLLYGDDYILEYGLKENRYEVYLKLASKK